MSSGKSKSKKRSGFSEDVGPPYSANEPTSASTEQSVELGAGGRLVIPAPMRKALGMKIGDRLIVRLESQGLRVHSYEEGLRQAREILAQHLPAGVDPIDDFLRWKRDQAALEAAKHQKWTRGD